MVLPFLTLLLLVGPTTPSPAQDPNSEVEVFQPENTNQDGYDDYEEDDGTFSFPGSGILRVLVLPIPRDSFAPESSFNRNPFARPTSGASAGGFSNDEASCGLLCRMFQFLGVVSRGGDVPFGDLEPSGKKQNSTSETKILADGTVVRINQTIISDIDENGNSFVFHRSVFHTLDDSADAQGKNEIEDFSK